MRGCVTSFPHAKKKHNPKNPGQQDSKGYYPGGVVEPAANRSGEHGRAVLVHEPVEDGTVACSRRHLGAQLVDHAIRIGAADVVAFQQDFSAAARAHQLVAERIEAGGGSAGTEHGERGDENDGELEDTLRHSVLRLALWLCLEVD